MPIAGSCCIRCHTVALLPTCLRLVFPSSRLISSIVVSLVVSPFFDTVGRGVRRGASASCLLGFFPAVCSDVDRSVHAVSSCDVPSVCLPVVSAAGAMAFSSRPCGACYDVLLTRHLVLSLASFIIPSVRSVLRLSPRLATRWAGRRTDAVLLRCAIVSRSDFLPPCLVPRACLPRVVPRHPPDTDGGGGLRFCRLGVLCLLAPLYPCRLSSLGRSLSWVVRLVRICAVALML